MLLSGETGVGKEVVARQIHAGLGSRAPIDSWRSTAARCRRPSSRASSSGTRQGPLPALSGIAEGLFEEAEGGTIFLDEIGDVSPAIQVKLLRVLQEHKIRPVGENKERKVDVRVIAASNKDLKAAVREGTFRDDLYYRLRVVELEIPPLRDRPEDIVPLARFLVRRLADRLDLPNLRLDASCLEVLLRHSWPGNVRELENALERAAVMSEQGRILPEGLPPSVRGLELTPDDSTNGVFRTLGEVATDHIQAVLRHTGGNRTEAAKILGIGATTLWRRLKGIEGAG